MGGCFFVLFSGRLESLSARMDQHRRGGRCNDCPRDAGVWWRFLLLHEALFKHDPPIALLFGFFLFYLVFLCLLCCWFNFWAKLTKQNMMQCWSSPCDVWKQSQKLFIRQITLHRYRVWTLGGGDVQPWTVTTRYNTWVNPSGATTSFNQILKPSRTQVLHMNMNIKISSSYCRFTEWGDRMDPRPKIILKKNISYWKHHGFYFF